MLGKKLPTLNLIKIDKARILENFDLFHHALHPQHIIPVLKSNAYGHGIKEIASILNERPCAFLAVDSYYEALQIRNVSTHPLLVIGYILPEMIPDLHITNISFCVYDTEALHAFGKLKKPVGIHVKINTGMNRQGIEPEELDTFLDILDSYPQLKLEGILSHLSESDALDKSFTQQQEACFCGCLDTIEKKRPLPLYIHLAASHGVLSIKDPRINTIRLGIGLYGYHTLHEQDMQREFYDLLKPALTLESTIIHTRHIKKGAHVSYAGNFIAPHDMHIGVLPFGYYEGYSRKHSNRAVVTSLDGQDHFPVIGNVCMNMCCIDLGTHHLTTGMKVLIVQAKHSAVNSIHALAQSAETISYEVLVKLQESIRREIQ